MNVAEKLITISENTPKVFNAGYEKGKAEVKINDVFLCFVKMTNDCPQGLSYLIMQCNTDGDSEGFYLKFLSKE